MMLAQIIEEKQRNIYIAKEDFPIAGMVGGISQARKNRRNFKQAISKKADINLIAEIKKASPSRGIIREDFNPVEIAKAYQVSGAKAISVLTEEKYFLGSPDFINKIKQVCSLPILRKDFIIDEYQIYESCFYGADAILLIADILSEDQIIKFQELAESLDMHSLVEVHSEEDLIKVKNANAQIIGINNRDLHTFKLNLKTGQNLIGMVPKGKVIVVESGIKTNSDLMLFKSLGASAALIGEAFMDADDIGKKVKEILGR